MKASLFAAMVCSLGALLASAALLMLARKPERQERSEFEDGWDDVDRAMAEAYPGYLPDHVARRTRGGR